MTVYYWVFALTIGLAVLSTTMHRAGLPATRTGAAAPDDRRPPGRVAALLIVAILAATAGLRWDVGVDFGQYAYLYEYSWKPLGLDDLGLLSEPGLPVVSVVAARIHDDAATMFLLASIITVGLTVLTIQRNTRSFGFAMALYLLTATWQGSFNGVRQYLACAVVFAGHRLILERRFKAYLAVVLVACLFHISAVMLLLLYWVPRRRLGLVTTVLFLVAAALAVNAYPAVASFVDSIRGEGYTDIGYFTEHISPLRILAAFGPSVLYLLFTRKEELSEKGFFYANMMFLHGVALLSSAGSAYIARFSIYTGVFIAVAVPALMNMRRDLRILLQTLTLAGYAVFWFAETQSTRVDSFRWVWER